MSLRIRVQTVITGSLSKDDSDGNENGKKTNRVFSHDVTAAILVSHNNKMAAMLVSHNNKMAAMLVSQTSPLGVEFLSYANAFFCSNKFA